MSSSCAFSVGSGAWEDGIDAVLGSGVSHGRGQRRTGPRRRPDGPLHRAAGIALQTHVYLAQGGVDNLRQLHAFLCDTVLMTGIGFEPPVTIPNWGVLERASQMMTARRSLCCITARNIWRATPGYIEAAVRRHREGWRAGLAVVLRIVAHPAAELLDTLTTADAWW